MDIDAIAPLYNYRASSNFLLQSKGRNGSL